MIKLYKIVEPADCRWLPQTWRQCAYKELICVIENYFFSPHFPTEYKIYYQFVKFKPDNITFGSSLVE